MERFEMLVEDYNAGSINTETFFQQVLEFSRGLTEEEARAVRGAVLHLRPADAPIARVVRRREEPGQQGGQGTAGHPEKGQARPGLAKAADDARRGTRRRRGDPRPVAG